MTVRTRDHGDIRVYAGSRSELADVADAYGRGEYRRPNGYSPELFGRVAEQLRAGVRVLDLGPLRFYGDAADGTPFRGPYAPEPVRDDAGN
jgi:hypothetical protein